jgi:hypothetical protein
VSENLDLVRSIYADWERGDFRQAAHWADPDIELVLADGPDPGVWSGLAGMVDGFRPILNEVEDFRIRIEECREIDDERVLVFNLPGGRGRASQIDLAQMRIGSTYLFHIGVQGVTKLTVYWNRADALADLGLEE